MMAYMANIIDWFKILFKISCNFSQTCYVMSILQESMQGPCFHLKVDQTIWIWSCGGKDSKFIWFKPTLQFVNLPKDKKDKVILLFFSCWLF